MGIFWAAPASESPPLPFTDVSRCHHPVLALLLLPYVVLIPTESGVPKQLCGTNTTKLGIPTLYPCVTKVTKHRVTLSIFHLCAFLLYHSLHSCPSPISFSFPHVNLPLYLQPLHNHIRTHLFHDGKHPTPQNSPPLHHPRLLPHRPQARSQQRNSIRNIRPLSSLRIYNR